MQTPSTNIRYKVLILGGTFSPPHLGHFAIISKIYHSFDFDKVIVIPCKEPVIDKTSTIATEHRVAMLKLALSPYPQFEIDLCEIERDTPSYSVITVTELRRKFGNEASITLLIGMDNFLQFTRWHQWETILKLSHLLVVDRASVEPTLSPQLQELLKTHKATKDKTIATSAHGLIVRYDAGHYDISSTHIRNMIREAIKQGDNTDHLILPSVRAYIMKHQLF